jgi:hypothetical protein
MIIVTPRETLDLSGQDRDRFASSLQQLFRDLYDRHEIVQEVLIDGVSFREGYNEYLLENMETVRRVEIRTVPANELMREIAGELMGYLPRLLSACDSISELFYGEMTQEHWTYFNQMTEGIGWLMQSVHALRHHLERTGENVALTAALSEFEAGLKDQLAELARELGSGDHTAVGDRIKYEIPPLLDTLLERLAG